MYLIELFIVFIFGLIFGSFLNVVIYRLPTALDNEVIRDISFPASHCTSCNAPLKVWHNIPLLSYFLLKGRCGFCHSPINLQYPFVELTNACLWLLCIWNWGMQPAAFFWAIGFSLLLALSVIDWQTSYLPDALTQPLLWLGLFASSLGFIAVSLNHAVWGAITGYGFLWIVANGCERFTGKEGTVGAGNIKLLAALGAWLGPYALISLVLIAGVSGALVGIWLKYTHRLKRGGVMSIGLFLATAGALKAIFG
jgi:leader peptidase (prepilin peptidase)/N-methyltransferase